MKTASISSKATEEISLPLTTKLFTLSMPRICLSGKWAVGNGLVQAGLPLEKVLSWRYKWQTDNNKKQHKGEVQVVLKSRRTCRFVSLLATWAVVFLALRQDLFKEPQGKFHSFSFFPSLHLKLRTQIIYLLFPNISRSNGSSANLALRILNL